MRNFVIFSITTTLRVIGFFTQKIYEVLYTVLNLKHIIPKMLKVNTFIRNHIDVLFACGTSRPVTLCKLRSCVAGHYTLQCTVSLQQSWAAASERQHSNHGHIPNNAIFQSLLGCHMHSFANQITVYWITISFMTTSNGTLYQSYSLFTNKKFSHFTF